MYEIRDADGWTGVEAETLEGARLACVTIATEGYDPPLSIVAEGDDFALATLVGFDQGGYPIWRSSDRARRHDRRQAAA